MQRKILCAMGMAAALLPALPAPAEIYSVGHLEDGGTRSWLETWNNTFTTPRLDSTDVGTAKDGLFGSPHAAIGVGDLNIAHAGDEFILGRADGIGVLIDKAGTSPRIGGALFFQRSPGNSHTETSGILAIGIADLHANPGPEIVTIAGNAVMEVWAYNQASGVVDTGTGSGGRLDIREWNNIDLGTVADATFGEFDVANAGLEMALLRTDGFVDVFPILATASGERLAIWYSPTVSFHEPFDHFFSGNLLSASESDEIATIGSDGWVEIYDPLAGTRLSAPSNAYTTSGHDPFLCVTADGYVAPVPLIGTTVIVE